MTIQVKHDHLSGRAKLIIDGQFTFDMYREFLDVIDHLQDKARHLTVDLRRAAYMDSSALGLLLQMRGKLKGCTTTLAIKRDSVIDEVLSVANFDQLFTIEAD